MKILALCDSPTMTTGFARVAQNLFKRWNKAGHLIDCWGIGFKGWQYKDVPYVNTLFPAGGGGEWCLPQNLQLFLKQLLHGDYTHVWLMQDTFLLCLHDFPEVLQRICREKGIVSVLYFPVDAALEPEWTTIIAAVDVPIAYTHYGRAQAREALIKAHKEGWEVRETDGRITRKTLEELSSVDNIEVIPHGVDTSIYRMLPDRDKVRREYWKADASGKSWVSDSDFLMVNVNANQRRKDVVRSLEILAGLKAMGLPVKLVMHMPERSYDGLSLRVVGRQLGLKEGIDWGHHDFYFKGSLSAMSEKDLVRLYNAADLYLTTSLGEGWGLGITEALACGCPTAIPAHTACTEIHHELAKRGGANCLLLPIENGFVGLENDNSRLRPRVHLPLAVQSIAEQIAGRLPRQELTESARAWLSWDRIAKDFLNLMKAAVSRLAHPSTPVPNLSAPPAPQRSGKQGHTYYLEFGGGLGDVFNQMYDRGTYNVLRDLGPDETARVCLVTHNPHVRELFVRHPKWDQIYFEDLGYWHTKEENDVQRAKHNMPAPGANGRLPERPVDSGCPRLKFYLHMEDYDWLGWFNEKTRTRGKQEPFIVLAATAGLMDRSIPTALCDLIILELVAAGFHVVVTGRDYDRHGRKEYRPATQDPHVFDAVNRLTVPGVAHLVQTSAGLVTCHSALNILAWHERKPQLLLYPKSVYDQHIVKRDQWAFGIDYPETMHGTFDQLDEGLVSRFVNQLKSEPTK